ncbi:MAG: hypothetical protein ACM30G_20055 [Micromonosporaceae bacterium]
MNRGSRVRIDHHRGDGVAECEGCEIHPESTRERLRQHVARTGHTGRYVKTIVTIYRPKHPAEESP